MVRGQLIVGYALGMGMSEVDEPGRLPVQSDGDDAVTVEVTDEGFVPWSPKTGHQRIKRQSDGFYRPAAVDIQVPDGWPVLPFPLGDVEGDSMARKWGTSKILLAAAVVVFVLAAVGVDLGELNLIALGLALGFASFLV